ncbi:hypothetical protein Ddye_025177 [Dipteronia dyeriana]|uniref:Cation/H+ exchanger domain-containing protein n=1 Tax=Dipteronia dyeriana TaxID=168575 RepID=A0AAD9TX92_9ROSI|nr:hypothetical protein Ddye_025177 [Dipteronia dyeriana]
MTHVLDFRNGSFEFGGKFMVQNQSGYEISVCYITEKKSGDTPWQNQNSMSSTLPTLGLQLGLMILFTHLLIFLLKPLHQPRFTAQIIAGILLGPTFLGRSRLSIDVFTFDSNMLLETFANLGITYYMFLVGLEMDLSTLKYLSKKSFSIAIAGILLPIAASATLYQLPKYIWYIDDSAKPLAWGFIFWSIPLSVSSFPDLARILADVKLLHTDIGRIALSVAIISDIVVWALLVFAVTIVDKTDAMHMTVLPTIAFILICWFLLRPGIAWMIKKTVKEGGDFSAMHINFILTGVAVCGMITDACGAHSMVGGFMLGLIIPNGDLAMKIMEKIEEFVTGIMLPVFFMVAGLRTNLFVLIRGAALTGVRYSVEMLLLITIGATSTKILSTFLVSLCFGMSTYDGLALGNLLNTKGVLAVIVLNESRSLKLLDNTTMSIMMFAIVFMTALVGPIFSIAQKSTRRVRKYKQRSIQRSNQNSELRILTCIHSVRNVSGIINILEVSNATKRSPVTVFAVHLVELTGAASAMLIVHDSYKTNGNHHHRNRGRAESDQIINAFIKYESRNEGVSVHPLTAVSPYNTMHEDICNLSEDKHIAMILVPFHKEATADGRLQGENRSIKEVNQKLLDKAQCSVGILIDRGLGSSSSDSTFQLNSSELSTGLNLAVIFIGGLDDQEALSYGWKMAGTPGISLTVVRFLSSTNDAASVELVNDEDGDLDSDSGKELDDEFINEFRFKTMCHQSIKYHEKLVDTGVELVETMRTMYSDFDFYVVGRGRGVKSSPLAMDTELCDNPDLGPIGDLLVSSDFTAHASVLVMQSVDDDIRSVSFRHKAKFGQKNWASPILNPHYKASVNKGN